MQTVRNCKEILINTHRHPHPQVCDPSSQTLLRKSKFSFAFIREETSTRTGQHYSAISFACKTWKSQNWAEFGTVSKTSSSPRPHDAPGVKQNRRYTSTLWEGKLRREGGSDVSKITRSPEDLKFPWGLSLPSDHQQRWPPASGCSPPPSAKGISRPPRTSRSSKLHLFGE